MPSDAHEQLVEALGQGGELEPSIEQSRSNYDALISRSGSNPASSINKIVLGGVAATRVDPNDSDVVANLLWVHGGGIMLGTSSAFAAPLSRLFPEHRVTIPDYRRAPEVTIADALADVVAAYEGLLADGIEARNVVLGGDSVGGGLATLAVLEFRDRGLPLPAGLALVTPWTDFAVGDDVLSTVPGGDPLLSRESLSAMAVTFSGDVAPRALSPRSAERSLTGLPPVIIEAGTRDITYPDSLAFARALADASVSVTVVLTAGLIHSYPILLPEAPEGHGAAVRLNAFISAVTSGALE